MVNRASRLKFNSQSKINVAQDFAQAAMQQNFNGDFNPGFSSEPQVFNDVPQQKPQQMQPPVQQQISPPAPQQIPQQMPLPVPQQIPQQMYSPMPQQMSQQTIPTVPQQMPQQTIPSVLQTFEAPKKLVDDKPKVNIEKKPAGIFARIIRILLWIVLIVFLLLEVYWCFQYFEKGDKIPMTFGHGFVVENSGTMSPNIKSMDLCFLEQKQSYKIDSVIAYVDYDENPCVHRFLGIDTNGMYRAKGDASSLSDKPFEGDRIRGEVVFVLPFGGFIYNPLSKVAFGVILIVLLVVCYRWKAKRST